MTTIINFEEIGQCRTEPDNDIDIEDEMEAKAEISPGRGKENPRVELGYREPIARDSHNMNNMYGHWAVYGGRISDHKNKGTKVNPIYTDAIYSVEDFQNQRNENDHKNISNKVHVVTYEAITREEKISDEPVENYSPECVQKFQDADQFTPDAKQVALDTELDSETILGTHSKSDYKNQLEFLSDMPQQKLEDTEAMQSSGAVEDDDVTHVSEVTDILHAKSNDYELLGYSNSGFVPDEEENTLDISDEPLTKDDSENSFSVHAIQSDQDNVEAIPLNINVDAASETSHSKVSGQNVHDCQDDCSTRAGTELGDSSASENYTVLAEVSVHSTMPKGDHSHESIVPELGDDGDDFNNHASVHSEKDTDTSEVDNSTLENLEQDELRVEHLEPNAFAVDNLEQNEPKLEVRSVSDTSWPDLDDLVRGDDSVGVNAAQFCSARIAESATAELNPKSDQVNQPKSISHVSGTSTNSSGTTGVANSCSDVQEETKDCDDISYRSYRKKPGKNSPHIITNGSLSSRKTLKSILSNSSIEQHSPAVSLRQEHRPRRHSEEIHEYKTVKFSEDTVFHENKMKKYKMEKVEKINLRHIYQGKISSDAALAKLNPLFKDDGVETGEGEDQGSLTDDQKVAYQIALKKLMKSENGKGSDVRPDLQQDLEVLPYDRLIQRTLAKERRKLIIKWTLVILTVGVITAVAAVLGTHFKNGA